MLLGYDVENGMIVETTSGPRQSTTLTVESDNGYQFTVTREKGGGRCLFCMEKHADVLEN